MAAARVVACAECGTEFETRHPRAKYCPGKAACRKAASRRPTKKGKRETEPDAPAKPPAPTYDTLAEQVKASLTELEALETISGMAAVRVAQQIDRGGDSGSAVATLSKELSRLVVEAKAEAQGKRKDDADEIMERVGAKLLRLVS